ncbi:hypothetical protein ACLOJK_001142 [Asimina triloba]
MGRLQITSEFVTESEITAKETWEQLPKLPPTSTTRRGREVDNSNVTVPILEQSTFPNVVKMVTPLAPLLAVLTSSLLASSVFSENVIRLKSSMLSATLASGWDAELVLGGRFGNIPLQLPIGSIACSPVCSDYEHHGQQFGLHLELFDHHCPLLLCHSLGWLVVQLFDRL